MFIYTCSNLKSVTSDMLMLSERSWNSNKDNMVNAVSSEVIYCSI